MSLIYDRPITLREINDRLPSTQATDGNPKFHHYLKFMKSDKADKCPIRLKNGEIYLRPAATDNIKHYDNIPSIEEYINRKMFIDRGYIDRYARCEPEFLFTMMFNIYVERKADGIPINDDLPRSIINASEIIKIEFDRSILDKAIGIPNRDNISIICGVISYILSKKYIDDDRTAVKKLFNDYKNVYCDSFNEDDVHNRYIRYLAMQYNIMTGTCNRFYL